MRVEFKLSAAIVAAVLAAPVVAQGTISYAEAWAAAAKVDPNAEVCSEKSGDEAIAGCTAAIQSGKLRGVTLAIVFYGRGFEYQNQKDFTRAIADYSEAIRLDPNRDGAFYNRAGIYYSQKDYARAIADYTEAIRIKPQDAPPLHPRGQARRLLGQTAEGDTDIARACAMDAEYCEEQAR